MSNLEVKFLGNEAPLIDMAISLFGVQFQSFMVGDAAGFVPTGEEQTVSGNVTFVGERNNIKIKYFDNERSFRISMLIPEEYDNIDIGNAVLYGKWKGSVVPLLMIVLPEKVVKRNSVSNVIDEGYPYPASRMMISITVKYVEVTEVDATYTINIITPEVSNLPFFGTDAQVPNGVSNPWSQFIINEMVVAAGGPALVIKDPDDLYFTTPLFQNLASPKYGILDGSGYDTLNNTVRVEWIWGLRYDTDNDLYNGVYGGGSYTDDNSQMPLLGGSPYVV